MIRPVFISDMDEVVNVETTKNLNNDIQLYPNPANSFLSFSEYGVREVNIYDLNGRLFFKNEPVQDQTISVSNWNNGIYIITFLMDNGNLVRKKLLIQH